MDAMVVEVVVVVVGGGLVVVVVHGGVCYRNIRKITPTNLQL